MQVPELLEQLHPTVSTLLVPVLERLAQDAQERLIYRAQAFMVAQIGNFYPTPDQLRYPQLLEQQDAKQAWYPTLQRTLDLLSKVPKLSQYRSELLRVCRFGDVSKSKSLRVLLRKRPACVCSHFQWQHRQSRDRLAVAICMQAKMTK